MAVELVRTAIAQNEKEGRGIEKLMAVTVGWPAPVQDPQSGDVVIDDSMRPWLGIRRPAEKLKELLAFDDDIDFWTENDANLAAAMELEHGIGKRHQDFLYVHWSSGIGGALVSGGKCEPGGSRLAGELGHVPIATSETAPRPCRRCGSDKCLEVLAGGAAIVRNLTGEDTNMSLRQVIAMAQGDDADAHRAKDELRRAATLIGQALGPIVTFTNPSAIILGGQFGRVHPDEAAEPRLSGNPYDLIEAAFRVSLQKHTSARALNAVLEMNSSPWHYAAAQGAVAFGTRRALERYVHDRAGKSDAGTDPMSGSAPASGDSG
jgi:predicted NBD/HSP70 family sugar kinase